MGPLHGQQPSSISPILNGSVNPDLGGGVVSPLGWLYFNSTTGTLWHKTGSGDTDWTLIYDSVDLTSVLEYQGVIDCSTNPDYPAADLGDVYIVSVAGKIGGVSGPDVEVGDLLVCKETTSSGDHATVGSKWDIIQTNIVGAVTGPSSSVDDNIASFNGVTGKIIKDSGRSITNTVDTTVSGQIDGVSEKASPVGNDIFLIEDSEDSNSKKKLKVSNLSSTDTNAIHKNVASEISTITEKASSVGDDLVVIEDSEDSNNKKRLKLSNFSAGAATDVNAIHKNSASEISSISEKTLPVAEDLLLIEDSVDSNNKKKVKAQNLPGLGFGKRQTVIGISGVLTTDFISDAGGLSAIISANASDKVGLSFANGINNPPDYLCVLSNGLQWTSLQALANPILGVYLNPTSYALSAISSLCRISYSRNFVGYEIGSLLSRFEGSHGATAYTDPYNNVATFSPSNASISTTQFKYGSSSLRIAADTGYVNFRSPEFNLPDYTNKSTWTLEFWFRVDSLGSIQYLISVGTLGSAYVSCQLNLGTDNKLRFSASSNGTSLDIANSVSGTNAVVADTWYHVAIVYDRTAYKVYMGVGGTTNALELTVTSSSGVYKPKILRVGNSIYYTSSGARGYYDDVRFLPYAVYTGVFTPPASQLPLHDVWFFDLNKMQMFFGYPSNWISALAVFVGEAWTGDSSILELIAYAINGITKSDPITITGTSTIYSFNHNLGVFPERTDISLLCENNDIGYLYGTINKQFSNVGSLSATARSVGGGANYISNRTIKFAVGNNGIFMMNLSTYAASFATETDWKIIFIVDRGW